MVEQLISGTLENLEKFPCGEDTPLPDVVLSHQVALGFVYTTRVKGLGKEVHFWLSNRQDPVTPL